MLETIKNADGFSILESIIDSLEEGVNIVDENGVLLFSNKLSAEYVHNTPEKMVGSHISVFYPQAALINVIKTGKSIRFDRVLHETGKIYEVQAHPIFSEGKLIGGFAVFKDVTEITYLNNKIEELEMKISINGGDDVFSSIIGWDSSLRNTIQKAKKTVGALGGPRHCIITGESGTGKTMLARAIYSYAKSIGAIKQDAPFIEVNCAQYTNVDIAAMEIFGSKEGAYTGSKDKKGLFELANGGILFLDEAHDLKHYQDLLLKAIESGAIRRIGGTSDIKVNVIVIGASTKNLKEVLIPELYQRLAQYALVLPPLRERTILEKQALMKSFSNKYEAGALDRYAIDLKIEFTLRAKTEIMGAYYPRNIRQFRDVINASIDAAVPLINSISTVGTITTVVDIEHLPFEIMDDEARQVAVHEVNQSQMISGLVVSPKIIDKMIEELSSNGFGPRRISKILSEKGFDIKYYQVAYKLKALKQSDN